MARIKNNQIHTETDNASNVKIDNEQLKGIQDVHEDKEIIIKGTDVTFIQKQCELSRNEAIELLQKANGDLKEALRLYIRQ